VASQVVIVFRSATLEDIPVSYLLVGLVLGRNRILHENYYKLFTKVHRTKNHTREQYEIIAISHLKS
jgi:hypothetical protein